LAGENAPNATLPPQTRAVATKRVGYDTAKTQCTDNDVCNALPYGRPANFLSFKGVGVAARNFSSRKLNRLRAVLRIALYSWFSILKSKAITRFSPEEEKTEFSPCILSLFCFAVSQITTQNAADNDLPDQLS
jgi:hypothetical protein